MKAIAERFKATMTGWEADNSDQEVLRLLPRPLYRYDLAKRRTPTRNCSTGPVRVRPGDRPRSRAGPRSGRDGGEGRWQYAFVRATSGGLEVKLGDEVVWTAKKHPANRDPTLPHFTMQRVLEK